MIYHSFSLSHIFSTIEVICFSFDQWWDWWYWHPYHSEKFFFSLMKAWKTNLISDTTLLWKESLWPMCLSGQVHVASSISRWRSAVWTGPSEKTYLWCLSGASLHLSSQFKPHQTLKSLSCTFNTASNILKRWHSS